MLFGRGRPEKRRETVLDKYHIRYTKEECLESILSIGQGEPISAEKYDNVIPRGLFPTSRSIIDKFGNWKRALNLAGFYPEIRHCLQCDKKFEVFQRHKDQRFCSDICRSKYYRRTFPLAEVILNVGLHVSVFSPLIKTFS